AALVEESVGRPRGAPVAAAEHLVVLDRRGRDLAVAVALEDLDQGHLQPPQLALLVGQHVSGPWRNRMNHPRHLSRAPNGTEKRAVRARRPRCDALQVPLSGYP